MLYVVDRASDVRGMTCLDNIMYVVFDWDCTIHLYNTDTLSLLDVVIDVTEMTGPYDIVVCRDDRQLYIIDFYHCIWRVSVDDHSYVKWLPKPDSSTDTLRIFSLSLTSRRLLVTSVLPPTVRHYSTTTKELLCVVQLPWYVKNPYHTVETTHGTFVISHYGTSQDEWQDAVSELFRFCHVLQH